MDTVTQAQILDMAVFYFVVMSLGKAWIYLFCTSYG